LRCFFLLVISTEEVDDVDHWDVDPFEFVDDVRCKEDASDDTVAVEYLVLDRL
jgi:hypothetical protein